MKIKFKIGDIVRLKGASLEYTVFSIRINDMRKNPHCDFGLIDDKGGSLWISGEILEHCGISTPIGFNVSHE